MDVYPCTNLPSFPRVICNSLRLTQNPGFFFGILMWGSAFDIFSAHTSPSDVSEPLRNDHPLANCRLINDRGLFEKFQRF